MRMRAISISLLSATARRCAQVRARRLVSGSFLSFSELHAESLGSVGGASPPEILQPVLHCQNRPAEGLMLLFHISPCCLGKNEHGRRKNQTRTSQRKTICDCGKKLNVNCIAPEKRPPAFFLTVVAADQLVVVYLWERKRERWRQIEGLSLIRLPYRQVHSAGSAAVSKLKLTGSARAACSNGKAGPGLTVIRRLDFMSLAPAKKSPDLLKGSAQVPFKQNSH